MATNRETVSALDLMPLRVVDGLGRVVKRWAGPHQIGRGGLEVDLRDRIQRLMWAGCYERGTLRLLAASLKPGSVFLDVGAHIGYFSVYACRRVGAGGHVHAFEADPALHVRLSRNLARWPQAVAWDLAVSDRPGTCTLYRAPRADESGWGSVFPQAGERRQSLRVPATSLDAWMSEHGQLRRGSVLKMDVEGAEWRVLMGARDALLLTYTVLVEANQVCLARDNHTVADVVDLLRARGLTVFSFPAAGRGDEDMLLGVRGRPPRVGIPLRRV